MAGGWGWYEAGDFFDTLGKIVGGLQEGEAVALPRACVVVGGFVAIDICDDGDDGEIARLRDFNDLMSPELLPECVELGLELFGGGRDKGVGGNEALEHHQADELATALP